MPTGWREVEVECKDGTWWKKGGGRKRKEKKEGKKGTTKEKKRWHLLASARQRETMEDGTCQLEHKDGTYRKGKKRRKKPRWRLVALPRQKESRKMVLSSFCPWRVSQQAPVPQSSTWRLGNDCHSHKVWTLFKVLLPHWALDQVSLCAGPLWDHPPFTTALLVIKARCFGGLPLSCQS